MAPMPQEPFRAAQRERLLHFSRAMKPAEPLPVPAVTRVEPVRAGDVGCRISPSSGRPLPGRPAALMSYSAFCRLVDGLAPLAELRLEGGAEPLLHPRIFDMVRYATARGIDVSLHSRLLPFSQQRAEDCVASGLARLRVPIDPARPDPRVMRNLERIVAARSAAGAQSPKIELIAQEASGGGALREPRN
jgi:hypothetical protein